MIQLPNNEKCYNLPEQVAQNLLNIKYLAEQYAYIDSLPAVWKAYKDEFDEDLDTFGDWTTTFEGWETTLGTYLANMSSAAVGAIAGQDIAPANVIATTKVDAPLITGDEIIEKMSGYLGVVASESGWTYEKVYVSACKNGNKLTIVCAINLTKTVGTASDTLTLCNFGIPEAVGSKLYPVSIGGYNFLSYQKMTAFASAIDQTENLDIVQFWRKNSNTLLDCGVSFVNSPVVNTKYYVRAEATFLLSDDIA